MYGSFMDFLKDNVKKVLDFDPTTKEDQAVWIPLKILLNIVSTLD